MMAQPIQKVTFVLIIYTALQNKTISTMSRVSDVVLQQCARKLDEGVIKSKYMADTVQTYTFA